MIRGWHYGRSWGDGRWIEDACPCPKEPCGLVSRASEECDQHAVAASRTIRQSHRPEDCPEVRP